MSGAENGGAPKGAPVQPAVEAWLAEHIGTTMAAWFVTLPPDHAGPFADHVRGQWVACMDDSAEVTFPDGSVASCLNGGPWLACALDAPESVVALAARMVDSGPHVDLEDDGLTRAERDGVDPELWDHGVQADLDRQAVPRGWDCIEGDERPEGWRYVEGGPQE